MCGCRLGSVRPPVVASPLRWRAKPSLKLLGLLVALFLALIASAPVARANVTIDSFQDRPSGFPIGGGTVLGFTEAFPHVLGGRAISLSATANSGFSNPAVTVDVDNTAGPSFLSYTSFSPSSGELSVTYGTGFTATTDPLSVPPPTVLSLPVDPTTDFLRLTFLAYDHAGGLDMTIDTLFGADLAPSNPSYTTSVVLSDAGSQIVNIPLAGFPSNTLDFLGIDFHVPAGTNFQLESVSLVTGAPEPATLWLLSLWPAFMWARGACRHR